MIKKIDQLLRAGLESGAQRSGGGELLKSRSLLELIILLGLVYGVFMGLYSLLQGGQLLQIPLSAFKVPLLFLLTLVVTVPSLYVFSTLAGARIDFSELLRLMLGSVAVSTAVLASLGPVTAFFSLSTESYGFMVLLNVFFFALSGFIGLSLLSRALNKLFDLPSKSSARSREIGAQPEPRSKPESSANKEPEPAKEKDEAVADSPTSEQSPEADVPGPKSDADDEKEASPVPTSWWVSGEQRVDATRPEKVTAESLRRARREEEDRRSVGMILRTWMFMYMIVGAQMSWILRPFIGDPKNPLVFFRGLDSNFFAAVWNVFLDMFR